MRLREALVVVPALAGAMVAAPAAAAADDVLGVTCSVGGVETHSTPPGSTTLRGAISGGPVTVPDTSTQSVTVSCWLQVNSAEYGRNVIPSSTTSSTTGGNVGVTVGAVTARYASDAAVYICTRIDWLSASGNHTFQWDDDETWPGDQCRLSVLPGSFPEPG